MSNSNPDIEKIDYRNYNIGDEIASEKILTILDKTKNHIVFITENLAINYYDNTDVSTRPSNFTRVYQGVNRVEMIADLVLKGESDKIKLRQYKENIAQAFVGVIQQNDSIDLSEKHLHQIEVKIKSEGFEKIRTAYLLTAFITTGLVILSLIFSWIFSNSLKQVLHSEQAFAVLIATFTGGLGAFISSFIRFRKYQGNIFVGVWIHKLDGFFRIFYGLIAGYIAALAVKANVIGGFMDNSSTGLIFITTIAGASEFFIPSLVAKMDNALFEDVVDNGKEKKDTPNELMS